MLLSVICEIVLMLTFIFNVDIEIDQRAWPGQCKFAFHSAGEGGQSFSSSPRGHNAERWLATQATYSAIIFSSVRSFFNETNLLLE